MTSSFERLNTFKKAALVSLGYLLAFAGGILAVFIWERKAESMQTQAHSVMYTAGEALLLIGVFSLLAIAPTGLAIYFIGNSISKKRQGRVRRPV